MLSGQEFIRNELKTLPSMPGVYRMIGQKGMVLYIGKAKNLKSRVASYVNIHALPLRLQKMVKNTIAMEVITTKNEVEAILLEASLIKNLKPRYNILLRDDKSFPYILIRDDHQFSQIMKFRGMPKKLGKYFGPFASAADVDATISHLQRIFQLRSCSDSYFASRERPCLLYQIKKCSAPCVGKISTSDYQELTAGALDFLSGKTVELQQKLASKMEAASNLQQYELAAIYRDRIKSLTNIQLRHSFLNCKLKDADIIGLCLSENECCIQVFFIRSGQNYGNQAYFPEQIEDNSSSDILSAFILQFYQNHPIPSKILISHATPECQKIEQALTEFSGHKVSIIHKKKNDMIELAKDNAKLSLTRKLASRSKQTELMTAIAKIFHINKIERIEVYDNSHISGTNAVGAMVVATTAGFVKSEYRRINVSNKDGDDYAMLREVLTRRLARLLKNHPEYESGVWPDLMLIDGGKGHLKIAEQVLEEKKIYSVKLVCIAKGVDRNAGREQFFCKDYPSFTLDKDSKEMRYLQILRDEAHSTAINAHKKKRAKQIRLSKLDEIPEIGPKRKKALLNYFGAYDAVYAATSKDLASVPGISGKLAEQIYDYLHS